MMNLTNTRTTNSFFSNPFNELTEVLTNRIERIGKNLEERRQYRLLIAMSDHYLNDVGVTRSEVEHELRKPIRWW